MRDTDADWKGIGETAPFWGVLTQDKFLPQNLTGDALDDFYRSGIDDIDRIRRNFRRYYGSDFRPSNALDFGCGVGRLSLAIAPHVSSVIGIDVAPGMRDRARERADRQDIRNARFAEEIPSEPFDWINSLIVFQHIPPARGLAIMKQLLAALAPGGFVSLHVTAYHTDDAGAHSDAPRVYDDDGRITCMHNYPMNDVLRVFVDTSISDLILEPINHTGHVGFMIYGRKAHQVSAAKAYSDLDRVPIAKLVGAITRKIGRRLSLRT